MRNGSSTSAKALRRLPVRLADHTLGWSSDLIFDTGCTRLTGFEVRAVSARHYFLPLAAAGLDGAGIGVDSVLHLVDDTAFYATGGLSLSALLGVPARVGSHDAGPIVDLRIGPGDGSVLAFVLEGEREVARTAAELSGDVLRVRRPAL